MDLDGTGVLVTRPADQAAGLCALIESAGGRAIEFAALRIEPVTDRALEQQLRQLRDYDLVIFISRNAVVWGLRAMREFGIGADTLHGRVATVGAGTARALEAHGLTPDVRPSHGSGSEALLRTPALRAVQGRRVLIVRGVGGREHLRNTLRTRGAVVDYAECYRRRPGGDPQPVRRALRERTLGVVTLTSVAGMDSLFDALESDSQRLLVDTPVVVVSDRQRQAALARGWRAPVRVADDPGDAGILRAVVDLVTPR